MRVDILRSNLEECQYTNLEYDCRNALETLSVNDGWTALVVFCVSQRSLVERKNMTQIDTDNAPCFEIHICWKVDKEARMEPPIQTEYFRSGGATILTFMDEGARAVICKNGNQRQHEMITHQSRREMGASLALGLSDYSPPSAFCRRYQST